MRRASERASVRTVSDTFAASTQGLAANAQNVRKDWLDESNGKNKEERMNLEMREKTKCAFCGDTSEYVHYDVTYDNGHPVVKERAITYV